MSSHKRRRRSIIEFFGDSAADADAVADSEAEDDPLAISKRSLMIMMMMKIQMVQS